MYTQIFFLRFIVLQNDEDLILNVHSTKCLKHIRTKKMEMLDKNPQNYEVARIEISVYEQKPKENKKRRGH